MNRALTIGYGKFGETSHRLGSMLFVAALLHGVVILGVTFTGVSPLENADLPVLKVTLLMDTERPQQPGEESDYLANRDSAGDTATLQGARPTNAISSEEPLTLDGDRQARGLEDRAPREPERPAEQLVGHKDPGAEAVHPGYGFLSEREAFPVELHERLRRPRRAPGPAKPSEFLASA